VLPFKKAYHKLIIINNPIRKNKIKPIKTIGFACGKFRLFFLMFTVNFADKLFGGKKAY